MEFYIITALSAALLFLIIDKKANDARVKALSKSLHRRDIEISRLILIKNRSNKGSTEIPNGILDIFTRVL